MDEQEFQRLNENFNRSISGLQGGFVSAPGLTYAPVSQDYADKYMDFLYKQQEAESNWEKGKNKLKSVYNGMVAEQAQGFIGLLEGSLDYSLAKQKQRAGDKAGEVKESEAAQWSRQGIENLKNIEALQRYDVNSYSNMDAFGNALAEGAGQLLFQTALALATRGLGNVAILSTSAIKALGGANVAIKANHVINAGVMGAQIYGNQYRELKAKGVDPIIASDMAMSNATVQAFFEQLSLGKMMKAIPVKGTTLARQGKDVLGKMITEGVTEFIQQYPEELTNLIAENPNASAAELWRMSNQKEWFKNAAYAGSIGFLLAGGHGGINLAFQNYIHRNEIGHINDTAKNRVVAAQRDGVNENDIRNTLNAQSGMSTVEVDAEALQTYMQQSADPKSVYETLRIDEGTLAQAVENGETVDILKGDYTMMQAKDENFTKSVGEYTSFEGSEFTPANEKQKAVIAKAYVESVGEQIAKDEAFSEQIATVVGQLESSLKNVGAKNAKAIAKAWAPIIERYARRYNPYNPADALLKFPLTVQGVDENGMPIVVQKDGTRLDSMPMTAAEAVTKKESEMPSPIQGVKLDAVKMNNLENLVGEDFTIGDFAKALGITNEQGQKLLAGLTQSSLVQYSGNDGYYIPNMFSEDTLSAIKAATEQGTYFQKAELYNPTVEENAQDELQTAADSVFSGSLELNAISSKDPKAREYQTKQMLAQGLTQQEIDDLFSVMDGIVDEVMEIAKGYGIMEAWQLRDINDPDMLYRVFNEKYKETYGVLPARSSFKKNGEYPFNFDLGALCTKRESMNALIQMLADEDGSLVQNLGPTQLEALKSMLKEEGFLTACDICFVETKRVRALNDANKWSFEWKTVLLGAGIDDDVQLGNRKELTAEQLEKLNEMAGNVAGVSLEEVFNKYIPVDRQRMKTANGKSDLDSGITSSKMQKIAKLILEDTTLAGEFNPALLLTTQGTDWLFRNYTHTGMAGAIAGMYGAATAKPLEGLNIYDALSWYKDFDSKKVTLEEIYDIGGFRAQSFTDFNPIMFVDYLQMFFDLQARQLPIHIYTKVPSLIELFGRTGGMFNMSLVAEIAEGTDKAHAGLKQNENGEWEYAWASESFPVEKAMELRRREDFGGRVGTIAVGLSKAHILKMLDDENIDMIIPYHSSGMPAAVKLKTGLNMATDYTKVQETKRTASTPKDAEEPPYDRLLQKLGDPRKAADAYLKWCADNKCVPKFEEFKGHKNYYKLLENFRGYDNAGNPVIQGPVKVELTDNWKEVLDKAMAERDQQQKMMETIKTTPSVKSADKTIIERAKDILKMQRLDSDVRDVMMKRLSTALGKKNVECLKQDDFIKALESEYKKEGMTEQAAKNLELFRKGDGIVYGFAKNGKITLNETVFNANTPAHEFSHVWAKVAQIKAPELWAEGVALLKTDAKEIWDAVVKDPKYANLKDENAIASEVLARVTGGLNEELVRGMIDPTEKMAKAKGINAALYNAFGSKKGNIEEKKRISKKLMDWILKFFSGVRSLFDKNADFKNNPLTYNEFIRMPLKTLWDDAKAQQFQQALKGITAQGQTEAAAELMAITENINLEQPIKTVSFKRVFDKNRTMEDIWDEYHKGNNQYLNNLFSDYFVGNKIKKPLEDSNGNKFYVNFNSICHLLSIKTTRTRIIKKKGLDNKRVDNLRAEVVANLPEIIKNSVTVQINPDQMKDPRAENLSYNVAVVSIREEENGKIVENPYTVIIMNSQGGTDAQKLKMSPELYAVYDISRVEKKEPPTGTFDVGDTQPHTNKVALNYIIKDVLKGVKDKDGFDFINPDGTANFTFYPPGKKKVNVSANNYNEAVQKADEEIKRREEKAARFATNESYNSEAEGKTFGKISWANDRAVISLFKGADASTVFHETGHYFVENLIRAVQSGNATELQKQDLKKLFDYCEIKVEDWATMSQEEKTKAHEKLAEAFETYLMEGKAPAKGLQGVFKRIKDWMLAIYKTRARNSNAKDITDDVREVFDHLLASDEELAQMERINGYFAGLPKFVTNNLSDRAKKQLANAVDNARDSAAAILTKQAMANFNVDRKEAIENYRLEIAGDVTEEVRGAPLYVASMQVANMFSVKAKTVAQNYVDGKPLTTKLEDGGVETFNVLAETNGFSSGDELAKAIINNPTEAQAIKDRINAKVQEKFPDIMAERKAAEEAAQQSFYNDESGILAALEQVLIEEALEEAVATSQSDLAKARLEGTTEEQKAAREAQRKAESDAKKAEKKAQHDAEVAERKAQREAKKAENDAKRQERKERAAAIRQMALNAAEQDINNNLTMREARNVRKYIVAERNAAANVAKALAKKDYESALEYKRMQIYNHAMVQASLRARDTYTKGKKVIKAAVSSKKDYWMNEEHFSQIGAFLARLGIKKRGYEPSMKEESFRDYLIRMQEQYDCVEIAPWLVEENPIGAPDQLSLSQFEDVVDAVRNLRAIVKAAKGEDLFLKGQDYAGLKQELFEAIADRPTVWTPNVSEVEKANPFASYLANMKNMDSFFEEMDNYEYGFFSKLFAERVTDANDREFFMMKAFQDKLGEAYKEWLPDRKAEKAADQQVYYDELKTSVDKHILIKMLMYLGSESSSNKLCSNKQGGTYWEYFSKRDAMGNIIEDESSSLWTDDVNETRANLIAFLSNNLTAEDVRYAQKMVDAMEMFWDDLSALERRTKGFKPKKVAALPVELNTPNGTVFFQGGYVPLIRRHDGGSTPSGMQVVDMGDRPTGAGVKTMHTNTGSSKARDNSVYPLDLRKGIELNAVQETVHDICFRELVSGYRKLINDKEVYAVLKSKLGVANMSALEEFLTTVAKPYGQRGGGLADQYFGSAAQWIRARTVNSAIVFNFKTAAQNLSNVALYGDVVDGFGYKDVILAYTNFFNNKAVADQYGMMEFIKQKSAFMAERMECIDITIRDIQEGTLKVNPVEKAVADIGQKMLVLTDNLSAVPVWYQAFTKKIGEGATEREAVRFADLVIRRTLGSSRATDVAAFQRGGPLSKLFTVFQGFFITQFNQALRMRGKSVKLWDEGRKGEAVRTVFAYLLSKWIIACLLNVALGLEDPFEEENPDARLGTTKLGKELIHYPIGQVGPAAAFINAGVDKALMIKGSGYRGTPVDSMWNTMDRAIGKINSGVEKEDYQGAAEGITSVVGQVTGTPAQFNKLFWNGWDIIFNGMDLEWGDLFRRRPKRER